MKTIAVYEVNYISSMTLCHSLMGGIVFDSHSEIKKEIIMSAIDFFRYFSAPLVGMVAIIVAIRNSKRYKLKRIDRLSYKRFLLENAIIRKYGFQRQSSLITKEDDEIRHIDEQIEMLKRSL